MSASSSAGQQPQQPHPQPQQQEVKIEKVEALFPPNTSNATKRLVQGIMRRTITPDGIRQLVRKGADPRVCIDLITSRSDAAYRRRVCLLTLAIDDWSTPTALECAAVWLAIGGRLVLPLWPSRETQTGVLSALIQEGVGLNEPPTSPAPAARISTDWLKPKPIRVAVRAANLTALKTLVANGAALQGRQVALLPGGVRVTEQYEAALMAIYKHLVKLNPCLATEAAADGDWSVILRAASVGRVYSRAFIHGYLQLMMDNGASLTAPQQQPMFQPLQRAAVTSPYHVIEWLCQHLSPAHINTATAHWPFGAHQTPLGIAAIKVAVWQRQARSEQRDETESREAHGVVLAEYLTVLNDELPQAVMDGVNGALCPQRDAANMLTWLLPLARPAPPTTPTDTSTAAAAHAPAAPSPFALTDATAQVAWKIGAFLHEPEAVDTITLGQPVVAHRIKRAMQHFVKCAATKTAGNEEVIGGMANVGGRVVRVPLQCFAVREGPRVRRVGLREVVHRARLVEAARYGLTGVVKGFNTHLGNDDCQFGWGQLGWVNDIGLFKPLGIN
ncbi:unnamed protein product [Vitrella brassicaformis CCMP3155]|uniref:Uncharacterized protein n=1 Tax=Vitrella brassicaformis (strain CCMP3155) TaxID=1169540 RepID=A0A0G4FJT2_VITBC|nr:unnamed protein product [Vitrella brassicaformis CCMP3155]|eukprot:CEM13960.1 unnamed protein product [Vitrella brassicaformis CCMP3155]